MADEAPVRVVVTYSPAPRAVREWTVTLPAAATVLQALQASGMPVEFPHVDLHSAVTGIWGRKAGLEQRVREGDRVEVYRGLRVDPKVARRERYRKQGMGAAGLFARGKGR